MNVYCPIEVKTKTFQSGECSCCKFAITVTRNCSCWKKKKQKTNIFIHIWFECVFIYGLHVYKSIRIKRENKLEIQTSVWQSESQEIILERKVPFKTEGKTEMMENIELSNRTS